MSDFKESFSYAIRSDTVWRALRVSAVVGTVLAFINHYDEWFIGEGSTTNVFQIVLTYLVPYLVSTHGQVYGSKNR
jgi:hypothetical protein